MKVRLHSTGRPLDFVWICPQCSMTYSWKASVNAVRTYEGKGCKVNAWHPRIVYCDGCNMRFRSYMEKAE